MDIKDDRRRIVVNGILTLQTAINVNVSKSIHILDNGAPIYISNAQVLLYKNNVLIDTMHHTTQGNYFSHSIYPVLNATYKVRVKVNGLQEVEALDRVPVQIPIISIDTTTVMYAGNGGGSFGGFGEPREMLQCKVRFKDIGGQKNYYQVTIANADINMEYSNSYFETDDPSVSDFVVENGALFDDALFDGKMYDFKMYIDKSFSDNLYVQLSSVSKSYYLYYKTIGSYQQTNGNPFSEPVMVFTNVLNGLGIFAGAAPSKQLILINSHSLPPL